MAVSHAACRARHAASAPVPTAWAVPYQQCLSAASVKFRHHRCRPSTDRIPIVGPRDYGTLKYQAKCSNKLAAKLVVTVFLQIATVERAFHFGADSLRTIQPLTAFENGLNQAAFLVPPRIVNDMIAIIIFIALLAGGDGKRKLHFARHTNTLTIMTPIARAHQSISLIRCIPFLSAGLRASGDRRALSHRSVHHCCSHAPTQHMPACALPAQSRSPFLLLSHHACALPAQSRPPLPWRYPPRYPMRRCPSPCKTTPTRPHLTSCALPCVAGASGDQNAPPTPPPAPMIPPLAPPPHR